METKTEQSVIDTTITINDVAKVELRVGTIVACEDVPKSKKLYRLEVDFGELGNRQILAGLRSFFEPADLVDKQGVFVYNLAPRAMMGFESHGMILCAGDEDGTPHITTITGHVPNGTRLR
ncbi:hypothetical protein JW872_03400 [Candidatus Babeliales bacterium]|nr:hypothetical protein [Candidatus Babeliales bacterium]